MRLLVQPEGGVQSLIQGIQEARSSIDIFIFRFDLRELEQVLADAVCRGVSVRALVAHTNRDGEENLRKLEMRLLEAGILVARTADDMVRYHGKLMIIDRRELYLLAFNLTRADIERSRSFGIVTRSRGAVREALRLFEADTLRRPYKPGAGRLVVSPLNAREELSRFIQAAKRELVIYDPRISDPAMSRLLQARSQAGVDIKILGRVTRKVPSLAVRKLPQMRLHTRTMVRDRRFAFVGSQSLRTIELDKRREVGILFGDPQVVTRLVEVFQADWLLAEEAREHPAEAGAA